MKKIKEVASAVFGAVLMLAVTASIIYVSYWVVKVVSYELFYEDMVEKTVRKVLAEERKK